MNKILIIQTRIGIGDLCVFLPCIHQIAKKNKNFEIHLLTKQRSCAKDFLKYDKYINKIFYLPEETGLKLNFSIIKILRQNRYQKCFIMHYGLRYYLLSLLANIKEIYFLLKEKKYKISGAKKFFKNKRFNKSFEVVDKLNNIKEKLIEIRDQL